MAITSLDDSKAKDVIRQVEFYFSDSNLPRDKFLSQTVQESEDGLVSLALICSFAKMRKHLGLGEIKVDDVTDDTVAAVADTLKKSNSLKISEDGKRVGRSTELPEKATEQVDSRTVAISPLPYDVQIEDLDAFFGHHGKVNSVRLPRVIGDKKLFCGTALVEFSDEEDAKKVLGSSIVYAGTELEMKTKKDFDAERHMKWKENESTRSDKDGSNASYPKGLVIAFKLNSIQPNENDSTKENSNESIQPDANENMTLNGDEVEKVPYTDDSEKKSTEDVEMTNDEKIDNEADEKVSEEGSKEKNDGSTKDENVITREDVKATLGKFGTIKFVDFKMGDEAGYVRFEDPDAGIKARAVAALDDRGGFILKNHIMMLEPLSDDAEREYWNQLRGKQQDKRKDFRGNNRGGRGGGRGNRGGRGFNGKRQRRD